jgi:hypothetical protein
MDDLKGIWNISGLVKDTNNDGVPDGLNVSIELEESCLPLGIIDFCGRLGFESTALSFSFFNSEAAEWKIKTAYCKEETACELLLKDKAILFHFKSAEELSEMLRILAANWPYCANDISGKIMKLSFNENRLYAHSEGLITHLTCEGNRVRSDVKHAEIEGLTDLWNGLGFFAKGDPSPEAITGISFEFQQAATSALLEEVCYLAARVGMCSTSLGFPLTGQSAGGLSFLLADDADHAVIELDEHHHRVIFKGDRDRLPKIVRYVASALHRSEGGPFGGWEEEDDPLNKLEQEESLFRLKWEDAGEKQRILDTCKNLSDRYGGDSELIIEVFTSEPKDIRSKLEDEIGGMFQHVSEIKVRSAFKPAFCWVEEEILPQLVTMKEKVSHIHIDCLKEQNPCGLELPIRWIQELYPVDILAAEKLGIDAERITFSLNDQLETTYCLKAYGASGDVLAVYTLNVPVVGLTYLDEEKMVYPTTGSISITKEGEALHHETIPTDRENFYSFYLKEVLPLLWSRIERETEDQGFTKPLFDRIEIFAEMSEEERRLGIDEERISSMEALHEDLYFNTLDYFMIKGEQTIGSGFTAPGGVYPFLHAVKGAKPKAEVVAYGWKDQKPSHWLTKRITFDSDAKPIQAHMIDKLSLIERNVDIKDHSHQIGRSRFIEELGLSEHLVREWVPAKSYRGENIPVLEMFAEVKEQFYSPIKMSVYKPTVFIEAGHHANEVSSTPAILELMKEIAVYHRSLLNDMNLVVIPLANPDGANLHQRMSEDNPEWKHHAARYNGVGLEYARVRYQETVFGEADVVPGVMKRWAPDIVIDDHGIPSHEWVQPFAGTNSPPRFPVSYWIPNSLLYGIGKELDKNKYPIHVQNVNTIAERVGTKIAASDIHDHNLYWLKRFKKYGNDWLPEVFQIEQTSDFIFYKWPTEVFRESTDAISRFPEWVSADVISETADETVYGEALERCKKAHKLFDLAIIEAAAIKIEKHQSLNGNLIEIKRQRPILL